MTRPGRLIAAVALCASGPAFAYRPFDGTDAAVAEPGQLEIELEPVGLLREGSDRFLVVPALIANAGIAERLEIVLEGRHQFLLGTAAGDPRTRFVDTGLSLKGVVRQGELQERSGPSVAIEVGALLPTLNDEPGVGAQAVVIVSRRVSQTMIHLNGGVAFSRSHDLDLVGSVIVEGPPAWVVRPVFELFSAGQVAGPFVLTGLAGMIWRRSETLAFDAGVRAGRVAGQPLVEGRLGLTFAIDLLARG
jgi:hypothetical protein